MALGGRQALERFQAPALARRIAEEPEFLREPVELDSAILFIDLSGYTGLSERLGPGKTREFLKAFHTLVVDVSGRNNGVVLKFMGDGAVIGFGLPDTRPNDEENAMRCAFAPTLEARAWFAGTGLSGEANTVQVGAHSGPVVLSRLGHEDQQQITVTGDCLNVASWLMEVGKGFEAAVTASTTLTDTGQLTFAKLTHTS